MSRVTRTLLMLVFGAVIALVIAGTGLRVVRSRNVPPQDSWIMPSFHEIAPEGFRYVQGVEWIAPAKRASAEALLVSEVAIPVTPDDLRPLGVPTASPAPTSSCTTYLVRGMSPPTGDTAMNRVASRDETIDVGTYGGFGCRLAELRRAPFVACLERRPTRVLTSFRCEPQGIVSRLLLGPGDRW